MRQPHRWILPIAVCLLAAALLPGPMAQDKSESRQLSDALKQMERAVKKYKGLKAEVIYDEVLSSRPARGSGTIYVSYEGWVRADIEGGKTVTFLSTPPYLYVYSPETEIVEIYNVTRNADRIVQYALLGFVPTGNAMKKGYHIELIGEEQLENGPLALKFQLRPKSKSVAEALKLVELWVDPTHWLPVQQKIYHAAIDLHLVIRYVDPVRDDELPEMLFAPKWPAGTEQILK